MRHFIFRVAFTGPIAALACGMFDTSNIAGLVALSGLAGFAATRLGSATIIAVNLTTITRATDDHVRSAHGTEKQTARRVHRPKK